MSLRFSAEWGEDPWPPHSVLGPDPRYHGKLLTEIRILIWFCSLCRKACATCTLGLQSMHIKQSARSAYEQFFIRCTLIDEVYFEFGTFYFFSDDKFLVETVYFEISGKPVYYNATQFVVSRRTLIIFVLPAIRLDLFMQRLTLVTDAISTRFTKWIYKKLDYFQWVSYTVKVLIGSGQAWK